MADVTAVYFGPKMMISDLTAPANTGAQIEY